MTNETVRVTVACDSCSAKNDLTINAVHPSQPIACSRCGGQLGTLKELLDDHDPKNVLATRPGTFDPNERRR